jgi:dGTPase
MISTLVIDLTNQTANNIRKHRPQSVEDVQKAPLLVAFSEPLARQHQELKKFLRDNLYRHYQVCRMTAKARRVVNELFDAFLADPQLLPPQYQTNTRGDKPRMVADYIAGMTDRYAMREHRRLFAVDEI